MDAESYLHWLGTTELEQARQSDVLQAVEAIVSALRLEAADDEEEEPGEMLQALLELRVELRDGHLPRELLGAFRRDFLYDTDLPTPPQVVLENELREIAAGIAKARWHTETYQNLENAIDSFLDGGDEEDLWSRVDAIEELIDRVGTSYQQTTILPKEVTMESMVTHKLLCEGIEEWREALAMLRDDQSEEEPDPNAVLQKAEAGNRLLVAVQIYHQRLQSALSTY